MAYLAYFHLSRYKIDAAGIELFQMFGVIHGCTICSNLNLPTLGANYDILLLMMFGSLIYGLYSKCTSKINGIGGVFKMFGLIHDCMQCLYSN